MTEYNRYTLFDKLNFSAIKDKAYRTQVENWVSNYQIFRYQQFNIAYHDSGQGIPLICLHGFPTSSWDWQPFLEQLQTQRSALLTKSLSNKLPTEFRIITLDFLGYGCSDKPLNFNYPITEQANIVEALLRHLGIQHYHIMAHDYGDTVAQELLARNYFESSQGATTANQGQDNQPNILSCCLLNGGLFPETHRPLIAQKLLASSLGKVLSPFIPFKLIQKSLSKTFHPSFHLDADEWQVIELFLQRAKGIQVQHRLIDYMQQRRQQRQRWVTPLQNPPCPILLINGEDDPISGGHMVQRYQELVSQAQVISIQQCGHYPQLEQPQQVAQAFLYFQNQMTMANISSG